jgi:nitric oxide dioxygenase
MFKFAAKQLSQPKFSRAMATQAQQIYKIQELTAAQKAIIKATVPTLEQAGEVLTAKFYQNMFVTSPAVKPFFNDTDQKLLRQPKILAFALLNYAKNIDDLTPLLGFVGQIVSKHVGLQVKAEHYPYVGELLLATMKELLGPETANEEFIGAWATAYGNLAQILINMEHEQFQKQSWDGFRKFKVSRIEQESDDVKSVYFTPVDPEHKIAIPLRGQYVCIRWMLPGAEYERSREYSLSQFPTNNEYRISVRNIGLISGHIHEALKVGDEVGVAPPSGTFVYEKNEKEAVFVVGGIGITPIIPIMEQTLADGRKATLLLSNKTVESRPFFGYLKQLRQQYGDKLEIKEYFSDAEGTLELGQSENRKLTDSDLDFITKSHDIYLLGPREYMKYVKSYLNNKGVDNVKLEFFGPMDV